MQTLPLNPLLSLTDGTAQELYHRLLSGCHATDDLKDICKSVASIEQRKQVAFARLAAAPNDDITELLRLIALQQSELAQIIGKAGDCRP